MKKVISILAALSFVAAVSAQKKPAKPAVPAKPAAPAVAAPAAPAAPAKPTAAAVAAPAAPSAPAMKKDESTMQVAVSGGYSIQLTNKVTGVTGGGINFGGEFLMGSTFQYGLGVGYMALATSSAMLPITVQLRLFVFDGLYLGVGGGYGLDLSTAVSGVTNTFIPITSRIGYKIDMGGWDLDLGVGDTLLLATTKVTIGTVSASTSTSTLYLQPYLRVAFKF